jgi:integrase
MFSLAMRARLFGSAPYIQILDETHAVRRGFLEPGDFHRLHDALPGYLRDPVMFLYLTGWRVGEMRSLEWRDVDGNAIRLRPENSKTKTGRVLMLAGDLRGIIARAYDNRRPDVPFVFHDAGAPIGDFRKAWRNALAYAGLPAGLVVHDLRRSAVRNTIRAGTPEHVAMVQSGHKTSAMLRRYDIVSEADLLAAAERASNYVAARADSDKVILLRKAG